MAKEIHPEKPTLVKDAAGNEIPAYKTLIDQDSFQTAQHMKHGKTGEAVITYHIPETRNAVPAEAKAAFEESPVVKNRVFMAIFKMFMGEGDFSYRLRNQFKRVSAGAPTLEPITSSTVRNTIDQAVADINQKMAGTLRLVPTHSSSQADIIITGQSKMQDETGTTLSFGSKKMVLIADYLAYDAPQKMTSWTITHELGHALGLFHPFNGLPDSKKPNSAELPCTGTTMTYYEKCVGNRGVPSKQLAEIDIAALKEIYADKVPPTTAPHGLPPAATKDFPTPRRQ